MPPPPQSCRQIPAFSGSHRASNIVARTSVCRADARRAKAGSTASGVDGMARSSPPGTPFSAWPFRKATHGRSISYGRRRRAGAGSTLTGRMIAQGTENGSLFVIDLPFDLRIYRPMAMERGCRFDPSRNTDITAGGLAVFCGSGETEPSGSRFARNAGDRTATPCCTVR